MDIILIEPEIPQNTGNIGRLCYSTNSNLILVGKLGFSLDEKALRRAGIDYWKKLKVQRFDTLEDALENVPQNSIYFFSKRAEKIYTEIKFKLTDTIVFGKESVGFSDEILEKHKDHCYKIPMISEVRSLNLGNAVSVVLYEALRQNNFKFNF